MVYKKSHKVLEENSGRSERGGGVHMIFFLLVCKKARRMCKTKKELDVKKKRHWWVSSVSLKNVCV